MSKRRVRVNGCGVFVVVSRSIANGSAISIRPDGIEQRGQSIPAPRDPLASNLQGFTVIGRGWLGSGRDAVVGDTFRQGKALVRPGAKGEWIIQLQGWISIGITCDCQSGGGGNLT